MDPAGSSLRVFPLRTPRDWELQPFYPLSKQYDLLTAERTYLISHAPAKDAFYKVDRKIFREYSAEQFLNRVSAPPARRFRQISRKLFKTHVRRKVGAYRETVSVL